MAGMIGLILLDVLRDGPSYGYGLRLRIGAQSKHVFQWPDGTLYRVLRLLERQGLVMSQWDGPKGGRKCRYYRLTPNGRRTWGAQRKKWLRFTVAVNAVLGL